MAALDDITKLVNQFKEGLKGVGGDVSALGGAFGAESTTLLTTVSGQWLGHSECLVQHLRLIV